MKPSLNHVVLSFISLIFFISDGMAIAAESSRPKLQGKYELIPNMAMQEVKDSVDVLEFMSFF